tara:strand:- start:81 stop:320 length:240 start_codon:yes stop_codon:yes gene_type:complete
MKTNTIEILIISLITGLFIYFRTIDYYKSIPRKNIYSVLGVGLWTYLVIKISPWFIIVGLVILNIFGVKHESSYLEYNN